MTWVRIEDTFADHPKVAGLPDGAFRLFVQLLCYANRHLTDGDIDDVMVTSVCPSRRTRQRRVAELIAAGLLDVTPTGWRIHDYLDYQPSRTRVKQRRKRDADRQQRRRAAVRQEERHAVTAGVTPFAGAVGSPQAVTVGVTGAPAPVPLRGPEGSAPPEPSPGAQAPPSPEVQRETLLRPSFSGSLDSEEVLPNGMRRWEWGELEKYRNTGEPAFLRELQRGGSDAARAAAAALLRHTESGRP